MSETTYADRNAPEGALEAWSVGGPVAAGSTAESQAHASRHYPDKSDNGDGARLDRFGRLTVLLPSRMRRAYSGRIERITALLTATSLTPHPGRSEPPSSTWSASVRSVVGGGMLSDSCPSGRETRCDREEPEQRLMAVCGTGPPRAPMVSTHVSLGSHQARTATPRRTRRRFGRDARSRSRREGALDGYEPGTAHGFLPCPTVTSRTCSSCLSRRSHANQQLRAMQDRMLEQERLAGLGCRLRASRTRPTTHALRDREHRRHRAHRDRSTEL